MADTSSVAIIIVSWNTAEYLRLCLISLFRYCQNVSCEIIVVDNDSQDDSVELVRNNFPTVRLICNSKNVGFAKACNQGIAATKTPYVLLLNSDCELKDDCITPLVQVLEEHQYIGITGSVLLHPNGKIQKAGGELLTLKTIFWEQLFFKSAVLFARDIQDLDKMYGPEPFFKTGFVMGASLCATRALLNRAGPLREDFFMYGEDLEFCMRAQKFGFETVIVKKSQVVHHRSKSTNKNLTEAMQHSITNNCLILAELEGNPAAYSALVYYFIGGLFRAFLAFFRRGISVSSWLQVLLRYPGIVNQVRTGLNSNKAD
jgi:GT2 family glycosyltransferase